MLWHEQCWPTIQKLDRNTPVVIPLGACEQHGRHLPLFVDSIQISALAQRVETILGQRVLLAPTLWLGSSHHHKDFPGTLSVPPSLYSQVIKQIVASVLRADFTRIFLFNAHGGNETPCAQALSELVGECDRADDAYLVFSSWWRVGSEAIKPDKHGLTTPFVSHACEYETSMMLFLRPDLVQMNQIDQGKPVLDSPFFNFEYDGRVGVYRRYHRLTSSGVLGEPSAASDAKGRSLFDAVVADVVAFLEDFTTWPDLPKIGPA